MYSKKSDPPEVPISTAVYLEQTPPPPPVAFQQPRRVTFQCQTATLPRRLGNHPHHVAQPSSATDDR